MRGCASHACLELYFVVTAVFWDAVSRKSFTTTYLTISNVETCSCEQRGGVNKIPHGPTPMAGKPELCQVQLRMLSDVQQVQTSAHFYLQLSPKLHSRAFNPCRSNTESLAADCPNAILEKPRIHPQELCLDICCCRLALIAASSRGPQTGLGPGFVWLQVRTQTLFSACNGEQED